LAEKPAGEGYNRGVQKFSFGKQAKLFFGGYAANGILLGGGWNRGWYNRVGHGISLETFIITSESFTTQSF